MAKENKSSMSVKYSNLTNELHQCMTKFRACIKDLQEPSHTFVAKRYTDVFYEFFCGLDNLVKICVDQNLTYPEMDCETVPILNTYTALKYIYSKLGIDDICDPSSERTRLLQTMINFIKYSNEKIYVFYAKMKAVINMKDTMDILKKQKDIIVNTINKKSLDRKQKGAKIKTIPDEVKGGNSKLAETQKLQNDELQELVKVKQYQNDIEKKRSKLCELKDNIIRDINDLRAQIVESPDSLKADHEHLKRLKNGITEKKSAMMGQVSAKKHCIIVEQELVAQQKRIRLSTDITEKNEIFSKLTNKIEAKSQKKCELKDSSEDVKKRMRILERESAEIINKINNFVKKMERERHSLNLKYDTLKKEIESMIKQSNHHSETIKSLEFEINKCNLHKKELENDVIIIMRDFEVGKNAFHELQNK